MNIDFTRLEFRGGSSMGVVGAAARTEIWEIFYVFIKEIIFFSIFPTKIEK